MYRKRHLTSFFVLAAVLIVGFAWGAAVVRYRVFPYSFISAAHRTVRVALPSGASQPRGRWRRHEADPRASTPAGGTRANGDLSEEQRREIERLEAIGYLSGTRPAPERSGVTVYDANRAWRGLNLVLSGHDASAYLMDMNGNILHEWRCRFRDVWPDNPISDDAVGTHHWACARLCANGDILAAFQGLGLFKLDKDSNLLWSRARGYHHDIRVMPDGSIYTLEQKAHVIPSWDAERPMLENFVSVLDCDGHPQRRVSMLDAFENSDYRASVKRAGSQGDPFHANSIQRLDGSLSHLSPAFRQGNVLVSIREMDAIAAIDLDAESVVWAMTGLFHRQHDAHLLATGNILLFDNQHAEGVSEALEFDPITQEVKWSYAGSRERPFYSEKCGVVQRLPNGNTLIVESDNGRAFEVTKEREIVWEYVNPHRAGENGELIATLFQVQRLPRRFPVDWAAGDAGRSSGADTE
ncbi:MAG: hypothetical protein GF400_09340 [Candidatus Eisenbacteria bacterium]|nr:hypothetical protein [Candidatus Eisenbacteria bacterium]